MKNMVTATISPKKKTPPTTPPTTKPTLEFEEDGVEVPGSIVSAYPRLDIKVAA